MSWIGQIFFTFSLLVYYWEIFCHSGTKILGDCQDIPVWNIVIRGFWLVHWHALSPGEAWNLSPASLQLSQSPYGCPSFATSSRCLHNVPLWRSLSLELPYHCWSLPDFCRVPQSSTVLRSPPQCSPAFSDIPQLLPVSQCLSIHSRSIPYFPPHHCHCHSLSLPSSLLLSQTSTKSRNPLATILSCVQFCSIL